ncbi:MAG: hypothetical protein CMI09_10200 [Oceanospirillaceae bacterium]|nr:hypothetical protein [Oceanospirillaceae bacterium]|tara:strand:- start:158 stop:418 length:261 start_codon:yes stop_codon:yes gene_type:complete
MTDDKPISNPTEDDVFDPSEPDWDVCPEDAEEFFVTLLDVMQILLDLGLDLDTVQQFLDHHADFSGLDSENPVWLEEDERAGGADD